MLTVADLADRGDMDDRGDMGDLGDRGDMDDIPLHLSFAVHSSLPFASLSDPDSGSSFSP